MTYFQFKLCVLAVLTVLWIAIKNPPALVPISAIAAFVVVVWKLLRWIFPHYDPWGD